MRLDTDTTNVDSTTCFPITLAVVGITTRVKHNDTIFYFGDQIRHVLDHIIYFFFLIITTFQFFLGRIYVLPHS